MKPGRLMKLGRLMTLDTILNWTIPIGIVIFFIGIIYIKVKGPADQFIKWAGTGIKNLISGGADAAQEGIIGTEITYE